MGGVVTGSATSGAGGREVDLGRTGRAPTLRELMREDARAAFERDPSADSVSDVTRFSVGYRIVRDYRIQHWLYERGHRTLALRLAKRTRIRYGADIHPAARIGRRFVIDHGIGVVIGGTAVIGDDCLMYQGTTLGMTGKHGGKRHPTLGSNVMIGAGSIVLGAITVGDGARVGAGSVVVRDVPANVTVVGNPAQVVRTRACPLVGDVVCLTDRTGETWIEEG
ncbi:serine O-acetyltransferase EpsC [Thermophilibacter mediterraneus]|uniref:serine O-acetyltransferase EpsC n=1 Tax=Thermophilibacter mediterraneus TaxID=1871031 RepID=UPI002357ED23|nr:serine O-acetyltransferase EpsC [Thermophilibacter mediterraneus]